MRRSCLGFVAAAFLLAGCAGGKGRVAPGRVLTGLDSLERQQFAPLRGKRIGLITNHTGRDAAGRSTVDVLSRASGVTLVALFSPEHGFTGTRDEERLSSSTLSLGGREVPIYSLYEGGIVGMRPKPEQLRGLDALVFDIQDIGARFYTYLATMGMALEEAGKAGLEFYVLDRPNPINGVTMEGPLLDDPSLRLLTPTAYFPVPVRHGMTAGEIARLHNAEVAAKLTVIPMEGWTRSMWYDQTGLPWIAPSPNMPDLDAATLYPGVALFEASNISVGRGTPVPFRWVGAPWMDGAAIAAELNAALLDGIQFSAQDYTPTKSNFHGELCHGVRMTITDRERLRPTAVFRKLHESIRHAHPDKFIWFWPEVKKMMGTDEFHRVDERGGDPVQVQNLFEQGIEKFEAVRKPYLLYQ